MKGGAHNLAVFGAAPSFDAPLHVNTPAVGDRASFLARVGDMLDRRWFTNDGPYVVELEQRIAQHVGVKHCVAVANGTLGLMLAARALDLTGQVLVPSFTFVATAHALAWQGLEPVFCDIDPRTWNIDPRACEAALTPATSAICGVHLFGRPCETEALHELSGRHGLRLIFDAAHAFGCTRGGKPIGGFGDAEVFSFHATKVFHTFEGGAVVTNSDELAARLRLLRNFGFTGFDNVSALGTNAKMPEVCAAMGLANLEGLDEVVRDNERVYEAYRSGLEGIDGLSLRGYEARERHNWHYVVVEVTHEELGLSRDELVRILETENVLARRYFYPGCHAAEPYASRDPVAGERLPHTVAAAARVLVLPGGPAMTPAHVRSVCRVLRAASSRPREVREALTARAVQASGAYPNSTISSAQACSTAVTSSAPRSRSNRPTDVGATGDP